MLNVVFIVSRDRYIINTLLDSTANFIFYDKIEKKNVAYHFFFQHKLDYLLELAKDSLERGVVSSDESKSKRCLVFNTIVSFRDCPGTNFGESI